MKSTDAHHEVSNAMSELNPATNFGLEKTFKIRKVKKRIKNISKTGMHFILTLH